MAPELKKATPVRLKSLGLGEKWLQEHIEAETSLLGLGDLQIIKREHNQPTGGRIDFLMHDPDTEIRYEIEIMLGTLDPSHIIRTIEYWDIERQRDPSRDHQAVIVAEEITGRFFNVIRLLNRAVPMIALQLNAFTVDDGLVLHFTKVLDVLEVEEDIEPQDQVDRDWWVKQTNAVSLGIADRIIGMVHSPKGSPRITYNRGHIALGTAGYNFCWLRPRRTAVHCFISLRPADTDRDAIIQRLDEAGISAAPRGRTEIKLKITAKDLDANASLVGEIVGQCEEASREK